MGWFDDDGYLYLGDRMQDMILSGGANIYPAEIEAVLQEHPGVRSVCVIGLPDEDQGNVVHAIVEADAASLDPTDAAGLRGRAVGQVQGTAHGRDRRRAPPRRRRQGAPGPAACRPVVSLGAVTRPPRVLAMEAWRLRAAER